jgi:signal transduction histidine kinase
VLIRRDGTEYAIEDTAAPIREDSSDIKGVVLVFHDVGDRRKLERELYDRTARLIEADRRKDEFLAMLAHELRNPLASISNSIQLLRMRNTAEHSEWCKEVIERQVKHLCRLIDDLIDVSRITRGKIELRRERIDASNVIESAVEAVRALIEERKHELAVSFSAGTLWCEADPTRLEQALINLLTNAAKYTEPGGHIRLTAQRKGDHIAFEVKDDGVGIPPAMLPEMFELFAQGNRTIARSEGGLGIGLTVVKRIAELHGGTATAFSEGPGRGSEFTLALPAVPEPAPLCAQVPITKSERGRCSRVLIVDDNVDTAHGLARLLRLLGHETRTVHDGPAAITEAIAFRPEFILLDIGLPGMDGYEVARRLRDDEEFRHAVIIAISGYAQEEDRLRSHEAGFNHHLAKPVDYDALIALIGQTAF